jgi:PAS domain S-box-containing protein
VSYIALRNYKATGRLQILLLGCGVLAFGLAAVVAGLLRRVPGVGANLNVTIFNTGALIAAIFHFIAALILLAGISPEVGSKRKGLWLILGYAGLTIFMALLTMASLKGILPPFFVQGIGPTMLRQGVLGTATILFIFSFLILMGSYLRNKEVFLYWYSSALALIAIGLSAVFIQRAVGSPIGWAGRLGQYIGGVYFLIAVITAIRSAQVRRISLDNVLTASLSPGEEKFRALAENSPDLIDRLDREMKHIYVNPAGLRLYGKPAGSIIGKTIEETGLPEAYCSLLKGRIQKVFETGQPMEAEDYLLTKNGMGFYQSHCVPEYGVDGAVANVLVVSRDLTGRKRAEEEIKKLNEELRQHVVRVESVNKELEAFAYSVSHDLRAPLRSIDGFSQALLEDYSEKFDEQGRNYLHRVRASTQRMAQLIDDVLNLSRVTRAEMRYEPVNLTTLANRVVADLRRLNPERKAEFIIKDGLVAKGDARLLYMVLDNLLSNALKFTEKHPGAKIEFGATHVGHDKPVFYVRDDGVGFDMTYVDKLFAPFQRLHSSTEFPGTGIGLATVQRIIHRHGGRVWAEGKVEQGATFYFTLP